MLRVPSAVMFVAGALLFGCGGLPRNCATITSPAGQELLVLRSSGGWVCCVHRTPLVTTRGFGPRFGFIVDPTETEYNASLKWPNFLKAGWELKRSKDISTPTTLMYCPKCQDELQRVEPRERI